MKHQILALFFSACLGTTSMSFGAEDGYDSAQVISALKALNDGYKQSEALDLSVVKRVISDCRSHQALAKLAVACRVLASDHNVGDDPACGVYDAAFWECVRKLSLARGADAERAMKMVLRYCDLQAGDLLRFREMTHMP